MSDDTVEIRIRHWVARDQVETGLAELASASAWQRHRGDVPCVDCGVCAAAMWTQRVVIARVTREWQVCGRCLLRRIVEG